MLRTGAAPAPAGPAAPPARQPAEPARQPRRQWEKTPKKMPDPCSPGLPPPRSSEVSIPISTASSLRTSNGCNWLLQKFILRKESGGSGGGRLGEREAAAVMRFWKPRCHPRGWQGEGRLASPRARSRRRTKRRLKTSLAECGCHTTVENTQQPSRDSRPPFTAGRRHGDCGPHSRPRPHPR